MSCELIANRADDTLAAMRTARQTGFVAGALYYLGFLALFCSLGSFASGALLRYQASRWLLTIAQVQDCSLGMYPFRKDPKLYNLSCGITYQVGGRSYKNMLQTTLTRSTAERDAITRWISINRGAVLTIRVNPSAPHEFVVQNQLPGSQGREPGVFINLGIILASISLVLLGCAHRLARRGQAIGIGV